MTSQLKREMTFAKMDAIIRSLEVGCKRRRNVGRDYNSYRETSIAIKGIKVVILIFFFVFVWLLVVNLLYLPKKYLR